tara:strand:- start:221 stop:643 length:423 start_codon:yes stop_codon:yes gene_type:complete
MANDLDLTRPNLFVTIPMSKGDNDMNIPSRRSRGFKMTKQSRSQLINWLKEYDQQAHEALNFSPEEAVATEATNVLGEQITGAQIRYYCKQQGLGKFRKPATPAPQEIDLQTLKAYVAQAQNLIETLALTIAKCEKELSK